MALRPCRSCKNPTATDAKTCPKCGTPNPAGGWTKNPTANGIVAVVLLVGFAWCATSVARGGSSGPSAPAPAASSPKVIEIDARALSAAYIRNEVGADEQYRGKAVKATGVATRIGKTVGDTPYVTLQGVPDDIRDVQCLFDQVPPELGRLRPGQRVQVQGTVSGLMGTIGVEHCRLLAFWP